MRFHSSKTLFALKQETDLTHQLLKESSPSLIRIALLIEIFIDHREGEGVGAYQYSPCMCRHIACWTKGVSIVVFSSTISKIVVLLMLEYWLIEGLCLLKVAVSWPDACNKNTLLVYAIGLLLTSLLLVVHCLLLLDLLLCCLTVQTCTLHCFYCLLPL